MSMSISHVVALLSLHLLLVPTTATELTAHLIPEGRRVEQWHASGHSWPPIRDHHRYMLYALNPPYLCYLYLYLYASLLTHSYHSDAFAAHMLQEEKDILQIPNNGERWSHYMEHTSKWVLPRFTDVGFRVMDTPPALQKVLKARFDENKEELHKVREEGHIGIMDAPEPSRFIGIQGLRHTPITPPYLCFTY
ncbi:hypothetical protein B484DRAFT_432269 [Ochromonadaceae sp. CCMP2298]|nr:hypothetical protein B484DRAFT_432269 [Ochromonadaceae sp. CCMP2298]